MLCRSFKEDIHFVACVLSSSVQSPGRPRSLQSGSHRTTLSGRREGPRRRRAAWTLPCSSYRRQRGGGGWPGVDLVEARVSSWPPARVTEEWVILWILMCFSSRDHGTRSVGTHSNPFVALLGLLGKPSASPVGSPAAPPCVCFYYKRKLHWGVPAWEDFLAHVCCI